MIKIKQVKAFGGKITVITDSGSKLTVAFRQSGRMVQIATAFCAPEDKFKRSIGRNLAIARLHGSEVIQLPVDMMTDNEDVESAILFMFY